jgi:hypothetical protein
MTDHEFIGTWRVVSFKAMAGEAVSYPLGERPGGYVGFDPHRFWVMLVDTSRKPPVTAALTDAEALSLMRSCAAYTGNYNLEPAGMDGVKLTVHVDAASNEALVGTDRVFFLRTEGDRLIFRSPAVVIPSGATSVVHLEFTRSL